MHMYEYKVIPAPQKGVKARGIKGTRERFANALQTIMNEQGLDGWQYLRTDTLPCDERQGLTRRSTVFQNMLVFCRPLDSVGASAPGTEDEISRTQKAIDQQSDTVLPEPTELWAEMETDQAHGADAEPAETAPDSAQNGEPMRLGGVTRSNSGNG